MYQVYLSLGTNLGNRKRNVLINLSSYFGNRMTFMPPYVITEADIDKVIEVLDRCLTEAERKF